MRLLARVSLSMVVAVLAISSSTLAVADGTAEKKTGTITGRVLDPDGKPVAGAHVRAFDAVAMREARQKNKDAPAGGKEARPEPVAKADTGADGTFTLIDVPVGRIRLLAGLQGVGVGMEREPVVVKAGETTKADDIKLRKGTGAGKPKTGGDDKLP